MDILKECEQRRYNALERKNVLPYNCALFEAKATEDNPSQDAAMKVLGIPCGHSRCPKLHILNRGLIYPLKLPYFDSPEEAMPGLSNMLQAALYFLYAQT